jgi:predicted PurR-regulated permease PerM
MWLERILSIMPEEKREHRRRLARKMYRVVVGYVNGQVFVAVLGGIFATIALFIMSQIFNAPINPIALGGIIGLFSLLPLIGSFIGATIVVLACLLVSPPLALAAIAYFIVYQQIENVTIQPIIQAKTNDLTPLIVFVAALLGVGFGGFLGAFLAIPTAGCIKVLIEDHFQSKQQESKS